MNKYHIITYGCQMNKSDSERIAQILEKKGYKLAKEESKADLIVITMCSVRQKAVDKIKYQISNIKNTNQNAKIILTGCVLNSDKNKFKKLGVEVKQFKELESIKPATGYIPIMRGCNNFCSYCVVPHTRGREKSRPVQEIVHEIKHLISKNVKEITLLGQNVNSYKYKTFDFAKLLKTINDLPGDFRIKFLTNHPKDVSDKLINTIAELNKVEKYIHLPIQAGDNKILKAMNRKYTCEQYLKLVAKIKKRIPNVILTTDIIVGFPGETKAQFQKTVDVVKKVKFSQIYIGKYSPRQGTTAYKLRDNVPLEEKKLREQILRKLISPMSDTECRTPNKLVVILGPTGTGKTDLSIKLAKKFNGEIVSADSQQVYKEMDIGTGKVSKKQMSIVPHHLIDIVAPRRKFSVSQYQKKAEQAINKITKKNKLAFLVGGSSFYIYSITNGWIFPKTKVNAKLRKELEKKSCFELLAMLKKLDPSRAKTIEPKNKRRLIRAIEISKQLGKVPQLKKDPKFDCLFLGITAPKAELEQRISKRVDKMIKLGLEKEVRELVKKYGFNKVLKSSIDYKEWEDYFKKQKTSLRLPAASFGVTMEIKKNHLALVKHQLTWFKRDKRINGVKNYSEASNLIKRFLAV